MTQEITAPEWVAKQCAIRDAFAALSVTLSHQDVALIAQSDFLFHHLRQHPEWLLALRDSPVTAQESSRYVSMLETALQTVTDEESLMTALRRFRHQQLVRINWAQLTLSVTTEHTLRQLSQLADVLILGAKNWLYRAACVEFGTPQNALGEFQPMLVLGMGKLGGKELNFSSDVDLIFVYPEEGETQGGARQMDNARFFTRLGQRLIKVLDKPTSAGFVYRVDMRLRPFGDSGPLVMSFDSLENYYQEQGRDWERYAMVKGRILGNEGGKYAKILTDLLRPFVYRRYIDFSVIQSLRDMKSMIEREVIRRNLQNNIKLGAGGIREIEFISQVFQLIRGGREKKLQNTSLLAALSEIEMLRLLPADFVPRLRENYLFLRRLENLLQGINDEQGQTLPEKSLDQLRLVIGMRCASWDALLKETLARMQSTRAIFDTFIGKEDAPTNNHDIANSWYVDVWAGHVDHDELRAVIPALSDEEHDLMLSILRQFKQETEKRTIGLRGRTVLDKLMPKLLASVFTQSNVLTILPRMTRILLNIVTRTTYLELLFEYPSVLEQLILLCARSSMIVTQLANHPLLLDVLMDSHRLYQTLPLSEYRAELSRYLLYVTDGEEQQIDALRQFKQAQLLHVAAADISGHLPTMKVSDHLTFLAEAIIAATVEIAWSQMIVRYGRPTFLDGCDDKGFLVVGYGKLGGWELGYGSDLDLIFLTSCPEQDMTDGEKSIYSRQFYQRLAQRVINLFSARTSSGVLYDIDTRLRPAGESGLLVSSIDAFESYQYQEAWTWEHQALVRARAVYGDRALQLRFNDIRHGVLCQARDETQLRQDVREMREKMIHHLKAPDPGLFDIKRNRGGIGDIEFLAQYLVLRFAHEQPNITDWSDNVRIFELLAKYHILSVQESVRLTQIYIVMRDKLHQLALHEQKNLVSEAGYQQERLFVQQCWQRWVIAPDTW